MRFGESNVVTNPCIAGHVHDAFVRQQYTATTSRDHVVADYTTMHVKCATERSDATTPTCSIATDCTAIHIKCAIMHIHTGAIIAVGLLMTTNSSTVHGKSGVIIHFHT